jgi:hypothetical protein
MRLPVLFGGVSAVFGEGPAAPREESWDSGLEEYAADHGNHYRPAEAEGPDEAVREDHLLLMHLLYTRRAEKRDETSHHEGYASLDSLREVSRMPAWRVWEVVEELQERNLVSCIWVSRGLRSPSADASRETSSDLRFLRGTQSGLTSEGLSYPPLMEYHQTRQQRHWERPEPNPGPRQSRPRRQQAPSPPRTPGHTGRKPGSLSQAPGGYHIYRPREQAARRLLYLVCLLCVVILAATALSVLALT